MANVKHPKPKRKERNADRPNGKAWKKHPKDPNRDKKENKENKS